MKSERVHLFTRNNLQGEEDVILHIFKAIFIALTLIIGTLIIHLEHNINITSTASTSTAPFETSNSIIYDYDYSNSYIFAVSLLKASEQLQDAISLVLSNYSGSDSDVDAELAWKNCSGSLVNGWGEIQDALEHVMIINTYTLMSDGERRAEMASQITAAEGFISSCVDGLGEVESTAASEVRAKMLLAKVHLRGRGDFLMSSYYDVDDIPNRLSRVMVAAWGIVKENLFYVIFCGVQLFFVVYLFHKLS